LPISASEHRAIVKAIAAGDPEAAGQAMRQHVMDSKERTLRNNSPQAPGPAPAPALPAAPSRKVTHA
jgi:DNA-binding FadR family transcriptional regulator